MELAPAGALRNSSLGALRPSPLDSVSSGRGTNREVMMRLLQMALTQRASESEGCRRREEYQGCCSTSDSAILDPGENKL